MIKMTVELLNHTIIQDADNYHLQKAKEAAAASGRSPSGGGEPVIHRHDGQQSRKGGYRVYWKDLNYTANMYSIFVHMLNIVTGMVPDTYTRHILKGINGSFETGKMAALMGPSGAGKTTLMEVLIGKRTSGVSGQIMVQPTGSHPLPPIKLSIVPQHDTFYDWLSVIETLVYASKFKNGHLRLSNQSHQMLARKMLKKLDLMTCKNSLCKDISGSEKKRLAIGCELISQPNFLVLDEPTSGLDSFAAKIIVEFLKELAVTEKLAILVTIHQPSWSLLVNFHKVYMLSPVLGKPIFEGEPYEIINLCKTFGIKIPFGRNGIDFLAQIAAGALDDAPKLVLEQMVQLQEKNYNATMKYHRSAPLQSVIEPARYPFLNHTFLITRRYITMFLRDRFLFCVILGLQGLFIAFYSSLFGRVGESDGCAPAMDAAPLDPTSYRRLAKELLHEQNEIGYTNGLYFMANLAINLILILSIVFNINIDMSVAWKEVRNGYYSVTMAFLGKTIWDCILATVIVAMVSVIYLYSTNAMSLFEDDGFIRYSIMSSAFLMSAFICGGMATVWAVILHKSPEGATFAGLIAVGVYITYSGLYKDVYDMIDFNVVLAIWPLGDFRWVANIVQLSQFGYERCGDDRGYELVLEAKEKIEEYFMRGLGIIDSEGNTFVTPENAKIYPNITDLWKEAHALSEVMTFRTLYMFFGDTGTVENIGISIFHTKEDDDLPAFMFLLMNFFFLRGVGFCLYTYFIKVSE